MKYSIKYLIVVIYFKCCLANTLRSAEEVRQYRKFLKQSVNGKPHAPATSQLKEVQHEWERSGKFEGDILLTPEQIEHLVDEYSGVRNAVTSQIRLWPNKEIIYNITTSDFTADQIKAIEDGIATIAGSSCLTFKKRTPSDMNYINVIGSKSGCFSSVGFVANGAQSLNLQKSTPGSGCFRQGTIIHEFLHALGFYHMQSTYNRDEFVKIVWEKIQPGTEHNFNKYNNLQVSNLGTNYDYGSVLHYSEYGFSIDGSKTIVPLKNTTEKIGQRNGMSETDKIKLNKLYKCPGYQ